MTSAVPIPPALNSLPARVFRAAQARRGLRRMVEWFWPSHVGEVEGLRVRLHPGSNNSDMIAWIYGEIPEPRSRAALLGRIGGRDAFIMDIGANSGLFTTHFARATSPATRILAIEPNPALVPQIRENLRLNTVPDGKVEIVQRALSSAAGRSTLHVVAANLGSSSMVTRRAGAGAIEVETATLASLAAARAPHQVFAIKIDVEGAEPEVLGPMLDTAADDALPALILIETAHDGAWSRDLRGDLARRGYRPVFEDEGNTLFERNDGRSA